MAVGAFFNFQVQQGTVAILRGFRYRFDPIFSGIALAEIVGTLSTGNPTVNNGGNVQINGISVPGYESFQLGQFQNVYTPCYVIAQAGDFISLSIQCSGVYAGIFGGSVTGFNCDFYGNILEATGRPTNYEPGFSEPIPVYDQTDYQRKKEKELISSNASISTMGETTHTDPGVFRKYRKYFVR